MQNINNIDYTYKKEYSIIDTVVCEMPPIMTGRGTSGFL